MNTSLPSPLALGILLAFPAASQGKVTITSPAAGASLDAMDENKFALAAFYLLRGSTRSGTCVKHPFQSPAGLCTLVLTAAAFLRWISQAGTDCAAIRRL